MVLKVSLKPRDTTEQSLTQTASDMFAIGKTRRTAGLALSSNGSWLVVIAGHKAYVSMTSNLKSGFTKFVSTDRLTCLAFHPTEDYFATGDAKGTIKLWYCLNDGMSFAASGIEKRCQTTSFHWHAHAVSSITFTPNGAYLLSGGEESVLVIWQLHTGKKEFVPRVGAPILSISVRHAGDKEEEYLLGLSDATFTFVSSGSLKVSRTFSRIKLGMLDCL
jgi:NET1-associated nuclear protein 1 (U3 small nucleolar RNA-associated protein 17)